MRWRIGIDTGSYYVKIVEGLERNGRLLIRSIGYFPVPFPEFIENLNEREQDVFVKGLKDFLREHKVTTKRGILSIGGSGVIIHYFNIPELPEKEINSAVQLEMMQVVPGGIKNLEYDYTMLPGKNNRKTVLFVGYPKEKCEFLISTMQMAGIKPLIMDHSGLAVLNSFKFLHKKVEETIFILNVGYKTSNLVLTENDGFVLVRDIPFGSKNITDTVASNRKISSEEAEIYGKKEENKNEVKKIISEDISELLVEVRASMEYFKNRTGKLPQKLFLTGGGSLFPGLCDTFEKEVNINANVWNPLEEIDTESPIPVDLKNKGVLFAVSLGLVLREIK
ncbi:MAG: pilus assembly protein PilM [Candidatus Omnitrophica bacterium]|nr:pilus assembly protein PilM [Candidatus Omnitrophota bacterium]